MPIRRPHCLVLCAVLAASAPALAAHRRIYLNNCVATGGCTVTPGNDDSRTQHSSVPVQVSHLTAWPWGDAHWQQLVSCVRDAYAPFDVEVLDQDPGDATHDEVIVAGKPTELQIGGAAGIAPGMYCSDIPQNEITFVFAAQNDNVDAWCWAAAQESAHVFGLDHELDAADPMTYLGPAKKSGFQDAEVQCGEVEGAPHPCACGGATQNSYQRLLKVLGPAPAAGAPGATCTSDAECGGSTCATDGVDHLCAPACVKTSDCAAGFSCQQLDTGAACWPTPPEAAGCSAGGAQSLAPLASLLLFVRRRRR